MTLYTDPIKAERIAERKNRERQDNKHPYRWTVRPWAGSKYFFLVAEPVSA